MNGLFQALEEGKVLKWVSVFPRYYKLEGNTVMYSDDLNQWNNSNLIPETLRATINVSYREFEVYEG